MLSFKYVEFGSEDQIMDNLINEACDNLLATVIFLMNPSESKRPFVTYNEPFIKLSFMQCCAAMKLMFKDFSADFDFFVSLYFILSKKLIDDNIGVMVSKQGIFFVAITPANDSCWLEIDDDAFIEANKRVID